MIKLETIVIPTLAINNTDLTWKSSKETVNCVFFHNDYQVIDDLFNSMVGIKKPLQGDIFYDDIPFWSVTQSQRSYFIRQNISIIGNENDVLNNLTVKKAIINTLYFSGYKKRQIIGMLNEQLELFNLFFVRNKKICELDDRSRLNFLFANAFIKKPKYLFLFNIEKYLSNDEIKNIYLKFLKQANENNINIIIFTNSFKENYLKNFEYIDIDKHINSKSNSNEEMTINNQYKLLKDKSHRFGFSNYLKSFNFFYKETIKFILLLMVLLITSIMLMFLSNIMISLIDQNSTNYQMISNIYIVIISFNIFFYLLFVVCLLFTLNKKLKNNYKYFLIQGLDKKVIYSFIPLMIFLMIIFIFAISFLFIYLILTALGMNYELLNWDLSLWLLVLSFIITMTLSFLLPLKSIDIITKNKDFQIKIKK